MKDFNETVITYDLKEDAAAFGKKTGGKRDKEADSRKERPLLD